MIIFISQKDESSRISSLRRVKLGDSMEAAWKDLVVSKVGRRELGGSRLQSMT